MRLIGLAGPARSGKDTVADMLSQHGLVRYAFARPLKAGVRVMFGLTEAHTDGEFKEEVVPWLGVSPRRLMQTLGTEWGRDVICDDVWLRVAGRVVADVEDQGAPGMVISDVRFDNEADWIRDQGGEVWHIHRPSAEAVEDHVSEFGVTQEHADWVIDNTGGLEDLRRVVNASINRQRVA